MKTRASLRFFNTMLLLITGIIATHSLTAQNPVIDSLLQTLDRRDDTLKAFNLNRLSELYLRDGKIDDSFTYAEKALALSRNVKYTSGEYKALYNKAVALRRSNKASEALVTYKEGLQLAEKLRDRLLIADARLNISGFYSQLHRFSEALPLAEDAYKYYSEVNNLKGLSRALNSLGLLFGNSGEHQKALKYYHQSLDVKMKLGDELEIAVAKINIGEMYVPLKEYAKANEYLDAAYVIMDKHGYAPYVAYILALQASGYFNAGDLVKAKELYIRALELQQTKVKNKVNIAACLSRLGQIEMRNGSYDTSAKYFLESAEVANGVRSYKHLLTAYEGLAALYHKQGLYDKAFDYKQLQLVTIDSLNRIEQRNKLVEAETIFETNQLRKDAEIKDLQLANEKTMKYALIVSLVLTLGAAAAAAYAFLLRSKLNRQQRVQSELKASRSQINPHFVFNSLNTIQDSILNNRNGVAVQYLGDFSLLLRRVLDNSFTPFISLAEEIRIIELYLKMESIRFDNSFRWKIHVDEQIDTNDVRIPPMLLQPFLENALIHGLLPKNGDRQLDVSFTLSEDRFICNITDNGIGRAKALEMKSNNGKPHTSHGENLVKNRVDLLNTAYKLGSQIHVEDLRDADGTAAGTKVQLSFDLNQVGVTD